MERAEGEKLSLLSFPPSPSKISSSLASQECLIFRLCFSLMQWGLTDLEVPNCSLSEVGEFCFLVLDLRDI